MKFPQILCLSAILLSGSAFAGTWIEVSDGPGRIRTYNGGGRFDAKFYESQSSQEPTQSLLVTCVDFLNVFSYGQRWEVNLTKIDGTQSLVNTRYGGILTDNGNAANFDNFPGVYNGLERYRMAAWLTSKLPEYASVSADRKAIQGAIWYLLDPVGTPNAPKDGFTEWTALQGSWLNQAITTGLSQSTAFYSKFRIVSQTNLSWLGDGSSTPYQEFITTVAPEPGTWLALAIALISLLAFARRRKLAAAQPSAQ